MKRMILFYIALTFNFMCLSTAVKGTSLNEKPCVDSLIAYYNAALQDVDVEMDFFRIFPDTYESFVNIYGYEEVLINGKIRSTLAPLYSNANKHIDMIINSSTIPIFAKLDKFISIAINGQWQADAVGYFQKQFFDMMKDNVNCGLSIIDNMTIENAYSVWYFMFDGPHPINKKTDFDNLYSLVAKQYSDQAVLMQSAFEKLCIASD